MSQSINKELCFGCFRPKGFANPCPACGFDEHSPRPVQALPLGTALNRQFLVGRVLGKPGGFGITYLAWDSNLQTAVAIKEYLPRDLAVRSADGAHVQPHTREEDNLFRYGLDQFLDEARTLARLNHPNIVRIRQFFEANGSAYLVMDYYHGRTLAEQLERQPDGRLPEATAVALMQPVLDGLRAVHGHGFLHRDIKPQNIYLARTETRGARPILLDFGSARQAFRERSQSMSVLVTPGYAPFEQYTRRGQGPTTDVYSAAAVLYRVLSGRAPPESPERIADDTLVPLDAFGASRAVSTVVGKALALDERVRYQSVSEFQHALQEASQGRAPAMPAPVARGPAPRRLPTGLADRAQTSDRIYPRTPPLSPHLCWLNVLVSGLAQMIHGQTGKGLTLFGVTVFSNLVLPVGLGLLIVIASIVDAFMLGKTLQAGVSVGKWQWFPSAERGGQGLDAP